MSVLLHCNADFLRIFAVFQPYAFCAYKNQNQYKVLHMGMHNYISYNVNKNTVYNKKSVIFVRPYKFSGVNWQKIPFDIDELPINW